MMATLMFRRLTASRRSPVDRLGMLETGASLLAEHLGLMPAGIACLCLRPVAEQAFQDAVHAARAAVNRYGAGAAPAEAHDDEYGYSWLVLRHAPDHFRSLVTDLKTVTQTFTETGYADQMLCSLTVFRDRADGQMAIVHLHKRGTFYPFAPISDQSRNNALELRVRDALGAALPVEPKLKRWFPVWGAPGLEPS
jgi:hypothetical protein